MKIIIETIPHDKQRYPTVGDYQYLEDGSIYITVSEMGDDKYNTLVALHELIEAKLTEWEAIKEQDITAFDVEFEKNRQEGNIDEPGFDSSAPYRKQHTIATGIELLIAAEAGVDWNQYDKVVNSL